MGKATCLSYDQAIQKSHGLVGSMTDGYDF